MLHLDFKVRAGGRFTSRTSLTSPPTNLGTLAKTNDTHIKKSGCVFWIFRLSALYSTRFWPDSDFQIYMVVYCFIQSSFVSVRGGGSSDTISSQAWISRRFIPQGKHVHALCSVEYAVAVGGRALAGEAVWDERIAPRPLHPAELCLSERWGAGVEYHFQEI